MDARRWRLAGVVALAAGIALVVGSFLPWEHTFSSITGSSSHSGMDCYCGGGPTFAMGVILLGLGGAYLDDRHPWVPPFAEALAWIPTTIVSVLAGGVVSLVWMDQRDDTFTDAIGIGVFVMAAGAALGLIAGILMWRASDDPRTFGWTLAIIGGLTSVYLLFAYIHAFLITGRFSLEAGILIPMGLPALGGLLALIAGIRILKANPAR